MNQNNTKSEWITAVYPWIIWTVAAGFFFYKYLVQVSPSVMTADLMKAFQVNGAGLGNLSAFYFYAYLLMQIPVGIMLDRYSPRLITTCAIFICSASTFVFSMSNTLWLASISRALMGAGAAFAAVSCFKLASVWFAPKRFAFVSGMFMTAAMLGAVFGQMPLSLLVQQVGWRQALVVISALGLALCVIYALIVRDKPVPRGVPDKKRHQNIGQLLKHIVTNRQAWFLSLYSGFAFAPVSVFGGLWGVPFLQEAYQLTRTDAAFAVSCIFIGFAVGAPFLGWLSDHMGRRKPILYMGTLLAIFCLSVVIYSQHLSLASLVVFLFLFGFGSSGFFTSFAMIRELFPIVLAATVLGIMNTFDSVCEALYEPLVGAFLDWTWEGASLNGVHHFSLHGYHLSLVLLPLSLLLALVTLFLIKETYCHSNEDTDWEVGGNNTSKKKSDARMPLSAKV